MVQQETGSSVSEPPVQTSQQATFAPGTKALSRLLRMPAGGSRVGDFSFFVRARNLWTAHLLCRPRGVKPSGFFYGRPSRVLLYRISVLERIFRHEPGLWNADEASNKATI